MSSDVMTAAEYREQQHKGKASKYHNTRVRIDGILFASRAEAARYLELLHLAHHGRITDLTLQPRFPILINGVKVMEYRPDFQYWDVNEDRLMIEDVKGGTYRTPTYRLKKRAFEAYYGREITEVTDVDTTPVRGLEESA